MSYPTVLFVADLESLDTIRNKISRSVFGDIYKPTFCLYRLIPPQRDTPVTSRLRHSTSLPKPSLCTKKYCSSIIINSHPQAYCLFCFIVVFIHYLAACPFAIRPFSPNTVNKTVLYSTVSFAAKISKHLLRKPPCAV